MGELLGLDTSFPPAKPVKTTETETKDKENEGEEEEQEFEFRLFSAPAKPTSQKAEPKEIGIESGKHENEPHTQKLRIRLHSPTPGPVQPGEGRFVYPFRGWEYYFTTPGLLSNADAGKGTDMSGERKRSQFEDVAVTGLDMMRWANVPWVSCSTVSGSSVDS